MISILPSEYGESFHPDGLLSDSQNLQNVSDEYPLHYELEAQPIQNYLTNDHYPLPLSTNIRDYKQQISHQKDLETSHLALIDGD